MSITTVTLMAIKASELWYKDVWENNESLLADMATQYDTLMDSVDIAD